MSINVRNLIIFMIHSKFILNKFAKINLNAIYFTYSAMLEVAADHYKKGISFKIPFPYSV